MQDDAHEPLIVLAAVSGVALPGVLLTALVDAVVGFRDGAVGLPPWIALWGAPTLCGITGYVVALRLDPNVPKLALLPGVVTTIIASVIVSIATVVWLIATTP